jgi:hypothetical protein
MHLERGLDEGPQGFHIRDITQHPGLGIHWTDKSNMAEFYAQPHKFEEDTREPIAHPSLSKTQFGTILHGDVDPKHTVQEDSPEWKKLSKTHHIYGHEAEDEVTVRPGAPVKLHSLERKTATPEGKERARIIRFNPPRKMKA